MKTMFVSPTRWSRFFGLGIAAILGLALAGCGGGEKKDAKIAVGFIYVGPKDDYGYNQAHAQGAAGVKKMAGVKVSEEEKVAETEDVQKTMKSMIETDGAKLIFPTSYGYFDPHVVKMAKANPKVMFIHCGGPWNEKEHPANISTVMTTITVWRWPLIQPRPFTILWATIPWSSGFQTHKVNGLIHHIHALVGSPVGCLSAQVQRHLRWFYA